MAAPPQEALGVGALGYNRGMTFRQAFQGAVAVTLCAVVVGWLGGFYLAPALGVTLVAAMTGVYIATAVALGLVWPVLAVAYVLFVTREVRSRTQPTHGASSHQARGRAATREAGLLRIEDAHHREDRDQHR